MFTVLQDALTNWNETTDSREKLQHTYISVAVALVLAAGIIGLINYDMGQKILFVAIIAVAMFLINAVAWALLQSFLLLRLGAQRASEAVAPAVPTNSVKKRTTTKK